MNTRIQVEHPVTEMITDIDLVLEQIRVAAGGDSNSPSATSSSTAIPSNAASMRKIRSPSAPRPARSCTITRPAARVRVDSAVYHGYSIPPYYDSLVGKLIVHGKTRASA